MYSKCKINWFDFDSVFKHVWKVLYCFLFKSFLINVLITFQRNLDIMQISKSGNFANIMWAKKSSKYSDTILWIEHLFVLKPHCETFFQRRQNDMKVEWKNKRLQSSAMPPISNKMFYKPENWRVMVNKFHIAAFVCFFLAIFLIFTTHCILLCCKTSFQCTATWR